MLTIEKYWIEIKYPVHLECIKVCYIGNFSSLITLTKLHPLTFPESHTKKSYVTALNYQIKTN